MAKTWVTTGKSPLRCAGLQTDSLRIRRETAAVRAMHRKRWENMRLAVTDGTAKSVLMIKWSPADGINRLRRANVTLGGTNFSRSLPIGGYLK